MRSGERFIALLRRFDRTQGPVCGGKNGPRQLKCRPVSAAWVLPGDVNDMENRSGCNEELATVPGEVSVRFIALWIRFDRTQSPVCGGKAGQVT